VVQTEGDFVEHGGLHGFNETDKSPLLSQSAIPQLGIAGLRERPITAHMSSEAQLVTKPKEAQPAQDSVDQ
jgi:hypothetical protein